MRMRRVVAFPLLLDDGEDEVEDEDAEEVPDVFGTWPPLDWLGPEQAANMLAITAITTNRYNLLYIFPS